MEYFLDRIIVVHFMERTVSDCPWTRERGAVHGQLLCVHTVHNAKYLLSMDDMC